MGSPPHHHQYDYSGLRKETHAKDSSPQRTPCLRKVNLRPKYIKPWQKLAHEMDGVEVEIHEMPLLTMNEYYLRLHKIVTGLSEKTLWEWRVDNPWNVAGLEKFLEPLPDEFHQWVRDMDAALQDQWEWFLHQTQGLGPQMEAASYGDRKQYAKLVSKVEDRRLIPLLFSWKDGKPLHETIMRYIKPGGVTKVWTGP